MAQSPLLHRAAEVVRAGGVIAYPTEAVYGLGCDPGNTSALERILDIKGRPQGAGFILIAADLAQLEGWITPTPAERERLTARSPMPVTWVVTAGPRASALLTGGRRTLAVRITAHARAAALCRAAGMPLVSTSANVHGRPPARTALTVRRALGSRIDLVVPGPTGGAAKPSEIRLAATGAVLRAG